MDLPINNTNYTHMKKDRERQSCGVTIFPRQGIIEANWKCAPKYIPIVQDSWSNGFVDFHAETGVNDVELSILHDAIPTEGPLYVKLTMKIKFSQLDGHFKANDIPYADPLTHINLLMDKRDSAFNRAINHIMKVRTLFGKFVGGYYDLEYMQTLSKAIANG